MKNFSFSAVAAATFFCVFLHAAAAKADSTIIFSNVPTTVAQQQQFYVDVLIDTHGNSINAIQGNVNFSANTLSFVRAETGSSDITLWINQPAVHGDAITFSGIIPGGFDGLINPFQPANKEPGEIVRLVFAGKAAGAADIAATNTTVAANDGKGTLETLSDVTSSFAVSDQVAPSVYNPVDTIPPTITASVVSDKDLYDGKYTLLFTAIDKQSGVDHVALKEGDGPWITIQSPYLLQDQSRRAILSLRAYDVAGNVASLTIAPLPQTTPMATDIVIAVLLIIIIVSYVIYKKFSRRVTKNNS